MAKKSDFHANFAKADKQIQEALLKLKSKRAIKIASHMLEHGSVNTEQIEDMGYGHAPRAVGDLRDGGVPLADKWSRRRDGKSRIKEYSFGDPNDVKAHKFEGRVTLPKELGKTLYKAQAGKCAYCNTAYKLRYLQIDHRVPYRIGGEADVNHVQSFMLLCGSCQRAKSWSCENCPNWKMQDVKVCADCIWASPKSYKHVATVQERRLVLTFTDKEGVEAFDKLRDQHGEDLPAEGCAAVLKLL